MAKKEHEKKHDGKKSKKGGKGLKLIGSKVMGTSEMKHEGKK
jgi:hypothetical protein